MNLFEKVTAMTRLAKILLENNCDDGLNTEKKIAAMKCLMLLKN
jgi:hypothetical protein